MTTATSFAIWRTRYLVNIEALDSGGGEKLTMAYIFCHYVRVY